MLRMHINTTRSRKPWLNARMSRQAYREAQQRLERIMQDNARMVRDCKHISTAIREALASDEFDQDTRVRRCDGCGRVMEDLG